MSVTAAIRRMLDAGLTVEQALIAAEAFEHEPVRSKAAERTARWRLKASQSVTERHSDGGDAPLSPSEVSPAPLPNNPNLHTPSPPKGGSVPAGFSEFWDLFPNKVGKGDALKAFPAALGRTDLPTLMAGLERYVAKTDDRPWCNPGTWLRQNRWDDRPAAVVPLARGSPAQNRRPAPIDHFRNFASEIDGQNRDERGPGGDWDDAPGIPVRTIEHHG